MTNTNHQYTGLNSDGRDELCETCGEPWDRNYSDHARRTGERGFTFDGLIMRTCLSCEFHAAQGYPLKQGGRA